MNLSLADWRTFQPEVRMEPIVQMKTAGQILAFLPAGTRDGSPNKFAHKYHSLSAVYSSINSNKNWVTFNASGETAVIAMQEITGPPNRPNDGKNRPTWVVML